MNDLLQIDWPPALQSSSAETSTQRRLELREFGSQLADHREQRTCGVKINKGRAGSATEILEVFKTCRRKWLCPTCGYTSSRKGAKKLQRRLTGWTAQGGAVALLTLTQSHDRKDHLGQLWNRLGAGWGALTRGSGWKSDRQDHRLAGYVRITEVVHSPVAGWNPHLHVVLLLDHSPDYDASLDRLKASLTARFARGVERFGGHAAVDGQDLRLMTPGTEAELAGYLFKGTRVRRSPDGSRTPMAILDDLEATGEGMALWDEWTTATSGDRRTQVMPSREIDSLCRTAILP